MTNEQIEKRFEFDLAMGVFKPAYEGDPNIISFECKNIHNFKKRLKFFVVLKKLGFTLMKGKGIPRVSNIVIHISLETKQIDTRYSFSYYPYSYECINEIPSYIKGYSLENIKTKGMF